MRKDSNQSMRNMTYRTMAVVTSAHTADLLLGRTNGGIVDLQTGVE